jgi:hypothetical protein
VTGPTTLRAGWRTPDAEGMRARREPPDAP